MYFFVLLTQFHVFEGASRPTSEQALPPLPASFNADVVPVHPSGSVRRLIHTRVGHVTKDGSIAGPRVLEHGLGSASLLQEDGTPVRFKRQKRE